MSWSAMAIIKDDEWQHLSINHFTVQRQTSPGSEAAFDDQLEMAVEAAQKALIAVGTPSDTLFIQLSGHANPRHGFRDGLATEFISVSVQVMRHPK